MLERARGSTRPRCATFVHVGTSQKPCNHPGSFHPEGGACRAFGCSCEGWTQPEPDAVIVRFSDLEK